MGAPDTLDHRLGDGISSRHVMRAQVNKRRFNTSLNLPCVLKPEVLG